MDNDYDKDSPSDDWYVRTFGFAPRREYRGGTSGCPCECNSGGFCGGCGHAGCGGRR